MWQKGLAEWERFERECVDWSDIEARVEGIGLPFVDDSIDTGVDVSQIYRAFLVSAKEQTNTAWFKGAASAAEFSGRDSVAALTP